MKKKFPKIKKKLKGFLTDESGKITKKDALGLAAGAALLTGVDLVSAGVVHTSGGGGHLSQGHASGNLRGGHLSNDPGSVTTTAHASGTVNGHYSSTPSGAVYNPAHTSGYNPGGHLSQGHCSGLGHASHGSHSNHSNHGSGGWC